MRHTSPYLANLVWSSEFSSCQLVQLVKSLGWKTRGSGFEPHWHGGEGLDAIRLNNNNNNNKKLW